MFIIVFMIRKIKIIMPTWRTVDTHYMVIVSVLLHFCYYTELVFELKYTFLQELEG